VCSPITPVMVLRARLRTNRELDEGPHGVLLARDLGLGVRSARVVTSVGCRSGLGRLLRTPRHALTVLGDRGLDELMEDVVGGVDYERCREHERIAVRLLEPADVTHGLDPMGARRDERHVTLLS
jgi:hypothetical protein